MPLDCVELKLGSFRMESAAVGPQYAVCDYHEFTIHKKITVKLVLTIVLRSFPYGNAKYRGRCSVFLRHIYPLT